MSNGNWRQFNPDRLRWTRLPGGDHAWVEGPIVCHRYADDKRWYVELTRGAAGVDGRVAITLDGPFMCLSAAKDAAAALVKKSRANAQEIERLAPGAKTCALPRCEQKFSHPHDRFCSTEHWQEWRELRRAGAVA